MEDFLILGAGIFGTSTAYYLSKQHPQSSITIIDRHPFPITAAGSIDAGLGASYDVNKIVRADYSVPFYMNLAHEAIDSWASWDLIKKFYHRSGWIALGAKDSDLGTRIRKNFKTCGREDVTSDVSLDEAKQRWNGVLGDMSTDGIGSAYFNPSAGWAEADKAVAALLSEAIESSEGRVKYQKGEVAKIVLNESNEGVKGVDLVDGTTVNARKVILATGAWTSKVMSPLEDQLGISEERRAESQVKAAGVVAMHWRLSTELEEKYGQMPVIIYGEQGEFQPPTPSHILKMVWADSFTNYIVLPSGRRISVPPHPEVSQYDVPENLKKKAFETANLIMPSLLTNGTEITHWRLCWDSITPEQHQLITRHPDSRLNNLYLVIGGSFHSWKFLPIIGKYAVNVIDGVSNGEEKDRNWAWKEHGWQKGGLKGAHEKVLPTADLQDYK